MKRRNRKAEARNALSRGDSLCVWGPGPVFAYEWLTTTRRWQKLYALRAAFLGAILIGMMVVWQSSNRLVRDPGQIVSIQTLAAYGENLYETIVSIRN